MEPFDNIESQTIERYYNNYLDSGGQKQYRHVYLGKWIIDLKKYIVFHAKDPDNTDLHHIVVRSNTHRRPRSDNSRFNSPITAESVKPRDLYEKDDPDKRQYAANWLRT